MIVITYLFTKLCWPGGSEGTVDYRAVFGFPGPNLGFGLTVGSPRSSSKESITVKLNQGIVIGHR